MRIWPAFGCRPSVPSRYSASSPARTSTPSATTSRTSRGQTAPGPNGPGADRPYVLLVEALARTGFVGVSKIAIRSRERLALLRPRHGVLVVQTLLWADELRDPGDLAPSAPVTDWELELAETLIGSLPGIEESELQDGYGHALEQLVTAKLSGGELVKPGVPAAPVDLLAALEESVQAARAKRRD
ncbi:Ku protein [Streptomyces sp. NPDC056154]|uniref:Ku protein n=1 Tax=unclassified Streptomyces TaxID=2593676 RepID=UPI0035E2EA35